MSTVNINVQITGNMDAEDRAAIDRAISQENERRLAAVPPLPALPNSTPAEKRASYSAICTPTVIASHQSRIEASVEASSVSPAFKDLRKKWAQATPAQQAAALAAITT